MLPQVNRESSVMMVFPKFTAILRYCREYESFYAASSKQEGQGPFPQLKPEKFSFVMKIGTNDKW